MSEHFDWSENNDRESLMDDAIDRLQKGEYLEFPTETGQQTLFSPLHLQSMDQLLPPVRLAIRDLAHARFYWPSLTHQASRLGKHFWPGPFILAFPASQAHSILNKLQPDLKQKLTQDGLIHLHAPTHPALRELLDRFPGPLALCHPSGQKWKLTDSRVGPHLSPTIVTMDEKGFHPTRIGSISEEMLKEKNDTLIVFVCTGNTCRSPMAEALFKKLLSDRLGCSMDQLTEKGYRIVSAGLAALEGSQAAESACRIAASLGADLWSHRSQFLTPELASRADYIVTMTQGHVQILTQSYHSLGCQPRLLNPRGEDIADPIGYGEDIYRICANQILESLQPLLQEVCSGLR